MTRFLLGLLIATLLQAVALAEGLAQIRFSGSATNAHLVEVEFGDSSGGPDIALHLHVSRGTTAAELAALVAFRAKAAGFSLAHTPALGGGASLWIDDAEFVNLRLGAGLLGSVSCVEGKPSLVKIMPPQSVKSPCTAHMTASTAIIYNGRPPTRGSIALEAKLDPKTDSAAAATALWDAGQKEWQSERPGANAWRPIKAMEGGILTGFSARLDGQGDWRLEVTL